MELVKKNLISIICGMIALIAVVLYFVPVGGWYSDFQDELKKRTDEGNKATALLNSKFEQPVIDEGGKAAPLPKFPSKTIIAQGVGKMTEVHQKSGEALQFVVKLNRDGEPGRDGVYHDAHELLVPNSLPAPNNQEALFAFRTQYNKVMTPGEKPDPRPVPVPGQPGKTETKAADNLMDDILHAVAPPTDQEIEAAKLKLWNDEYEKKVIKIEKPTVPGSPPQIVEPNRKDIGIQFLKDTATFDEDFRHKRATQYKVYMTADALSLAPQMLPTDTPSPEDVWYAQMSLWVQQDVCRAIHDMNVNPKDPKKPLDPKANPDIPGIARSRVKHVIRMDVLPGFAMYVTAAPPSNGAVVPGQGAVSAAEADPKMYNMADGVTGRVCNTMYDVVHSTVIVVCNESSVSNFVKMLQNNRLITAVSVDSMVKVDNAAARDLGYDYGTDPVVRVTLKLELLFMRGWTANGPGAPMPKAVMDKLGVQPAAAPAEPPAGGPARSPVAFK